MVFGALTANAAPTHAPALIELHDQFDAPQTLSFPTNRITLLTIADKKGSDQIEGWVAKVKERFGARIDVHGIADVSKVPGPLQGMVKKKFKKLQNYSVMMDWSGSVVKSFAYAPGAADILVLDPRGRILHTMRGQANQQSIQKLGDVIERALADSAAKASAASSP